MKIIRYIDPHHQIHFASLQEGGLTVRLEGDIYGQIRLTGEPAKIQKLLAPIVPAAILCIGLNYRHHAAESGMKAPEVPILFVKGVNALQNPDDPIEIPSHFPSNEVDYECELLSSLASVAKMCARKRLSIMYWVIRVPTT